jgi:hypothetical protein
MNHKKALSTICWGCLCWFLSGCAFSTPSGLTTKCSLTDSDPNRRRAVEVVSSLANANGMHDETEHQTARLHAMRSPQGYTLLLSYEDSRRILPYRIALRLTQRQEGLCATLYERRWWTRKASARYGAVRIALTNALGESSGLGTTRTEAP